MARRGNPEGSEVIVDVQTDEPVTRIEFDLEGDGEPRLAVLFEFVPGMASDGRYFRRHGPKFTRNGTWPLTVRAFTLTGKTASTTCTPGITVDF